jgi:hypothetical protein
MGYIDAMRERKAKQNGGMGAVYFEAAVNGEILGVVFGLLGIHTMAVMEIIGIPLIILLVIMLAWMKKEAGRA